MSKKGEVLALELFRLLYDYSESDIRHAMHLLRENESAEQILSTLARRQKKSSTDSLRNFVSSRSRSKRDIVSAAVTSLKFVDPEKFELLSKFDRDVRQGILLESNEKIRRFAESVSKGIALKKSRDDNIPAIMNALSKLSIEEIDGFVKLAGSLSAGEGPNDYQNLARFIIKGREA